MGGLGKSWPRCSRSPRQAQFVRSMTVAAELLPAGALDRIAKISRCLAQNDDGRDTMIRSSLATALAAIVAAGLSSAQSAFAQDESDQRLGAVHFATSCNETAQRRFDRGMRYQHSFWYRQAKEIFEDVAKADPECGMAFWGIALTLLNNPHAAPPASNLPLGLAAIQKAKAVGAKTQRERDYIDGLAVMYV